MRLSDFLPQFKDMKLWLTGESKLRKHESACLYKSVLWKTGYLSTHTLPVPLSSGLVSKMIENGWMYFGKRVQLMLAMLSMNSASVGVDFQGFSQPKKDPYLHSSLGSGDGWGIGWGSGGLEHLLLTATFYYTWRFLVHSTSPALNWLQRPIPRRDAAPRQPV